MKITKTRLKDLLILKPEIFTDNRGYFFESYNQKVFFNILGKKIKFVQENYSKSRKGVLRGLHYQDKPYEQGKLLMVIKGKIFDVVVDLRKKSKTYGNWFGIYLSDKKKEQLWIPEGFAHGYYVLSNTAEIKYKTTSFYKPEHERILFWQDKNISIKWPVSNSKLIISKKDKQGELFQKINKKKI
jgi:dTDP-4-dehydrorhamnose 3,5-epimerase